MIDKKEWVMIKALKQGMTYTVIAEYLGIDRKTVSKYKNNFESPKY
ncbi:MAG TPA: helix-turn-helix domain-containing protein [Spirochaetota bacterium]|nr:helix-turn-helix domain-containing protein [Spirochaetota bacterium]HPP05663.1 helix-turn-helix domain-containing protein [Spirochaetota bacterium]